MKSLIKELKTEIKKLKEAHEGLMDYNGSSSCNNCGVYPLLWAETLEKIVKLLEVKLKLMFAVLCIIGFSGCVSVGKYDRDVHESYYSGIERGEAIMSASTALCNEQLLKCRERWSRVKEE